MTHAEDHRSMDSYARFAWNDAVMTAALVEDLFDAPSVKRLIEGMSLEALIKCEAKHRDVITTVVGKTDAARPVYSGQLIKEFAATDPRLPEVILVLANLAQLRVKKVLELRNRFYQVLSPGFGTRVTCANLHAFSQEIRHTYDYSFPYKIFDVLDRALDRDVCLLRDDDLTTSRASPASNADGTHTAPHLCER